MIRVNKYNSILVCAFPYIIAFTANTMEIRLIVNGNLVHTMTMPKLQLLTSKNDVFFATTAPEFFPHRSEHLSVDIRQNDQNKYTPPSSPNGIIKIKILSAIVLNCFFIASPELRPLRLYRIPIQSLSRHTNSDHTYVSSDSATQTWKSTDSKLTVPEQPRVSRSATSSPIPPSKGKPTSNTK